MEKIGYGHLSRAACVSDRSKENIFNDSETLLEKKTQNCIGKDDASPSTPENWFDLIIKKWEKHRF